MKKTLFALAFFAFAGSTAFATDGNDKDGKKAKKETCKKGEMAGSSCCMKGGKIASAKVETKAPVAAKL